MRIVSAMRIGRENFVYEKYILKLGRAVVMPLTVLHESVEGKPDLFGRGLSLVAGYDSYELQLFHRVCIRVNSSVVQGKSGVCADLLLFRGGDLLCVLKVSLSLLVYIKDTIKNAK